MVFRQQARIGLYLQNNQSDRNIVQIFSADGSTVDAIVMTIPTYRPQPADETKINFAERPHQKPEAAVEMVLPRSVKTLRGNNHRRRKSSSELWRHIHPQ
jgi:hypothetical protein